MVYCMCVTDRVVLCSVVSVRGQLVSCRASANCAGGPGDDLGRDSEWEKLLSG